MNAAAELQAFDVDLPTPDWILQATRSRSAESASKPGNGAPASFPSRVLEERRRLAESDPAGEAEAVVPLDPLAVAWGVDPAAAREASERRWSLDEPEPDPDLDAEELEMASDFARNLAEQLERTRPLADDEIAADPVARLLLTPEGRDELAGQRVASGAGHDRHDLVALSWADLMAVPPDPPPMLRAGVPKAALTVLAGAPKIGKTLWLGQAALESGVPTLLVIEEGSTRAIGYRLRVQAASLGLADPPIVVLHRQRIRLDDRASVARLRAFIESLEPRRELIGFDPLNKLHAQDENKPAAMTPVLEAMAAIAYELVCTVIATHHLAKPSSERGHDIWDRFRGATSIRSGTDANLVMDGQGDVVKLVGEFRDAEPLVEYLELDRETLLFGAGEPPEAPSKVDAAALRAMVEERGQVIAKQVAETFEVSKNTALAALRALGCDEYAGPRGVLTFTLRTGQ